MATSLFKGLFLENEETSVPHSVLSVAKSSRQTCMTGSLFNCLESPHSLYHLNNEERTDEFEMIKR